MNLSDTPSQPQRPSGAEPDELREEDLSRISGGTITVEQKNVEHAVGQMRDYQQE